MRTNRVDVLNEEVGVFEKAEKDEIGRDRRGEPGFPRRLIGIELGSEPDASQVIEACRDQQQRQYLITPRAIEVQRGTGEPQDGKLLPVPAEYEEPDKGYGKEEKDKWVGIEKHGYRFCRLGCLMVLH